MCAAADHTGCTLPDCSLALHGHVLELSQARVGPAAGPAASWGLTFAVLLPRSQDSDLPALLSSVHRSRHLVMPEHQSRCEFQRAGVELGLGATGEERGAEATAAWAAVAEPKDSLPCRPPPPAALANSQGGRLSPGAPWDGNCANPGQPGRQEAKAVVPPWLLLGWA